MSPRNLSFIRDKNCHLELCIQLIEPHVDQVQLQLVTMNSINVWYKTTKLATNPSTVRATSLKAIFSKVFLAFCQNLVYSIAQV